MMLWLKRMPSRFPRSNHQLINLSSEMGLMHITGTRDGPPVKVGCAVTDLTTGLYTANSIMAALLGRAKTGEGQHLDVCLSDCQVATLSNMAESVLISGKRDTGRWGTSHRTSSAPSPDLLLTLLSSIRGAIPLFQDIRWRYSIWWRNGQTLWHPL